MMRRAVLYQRDNEVEKLIHIAEITGLSQAAVMRYLLHGVDDTDHDRLRKQFAGAERTHLCRPHPARQFKYSYVAEQTNEGN